MLHFTFDGVSHVVVVTRDFLVIPAPACRFSLVRVRVLLLDTAHNSISLRENLCFRLVHGN